MGLVSVDIEGGFLRISDDSGELYLIEAMADGGYIVMDKRSDFQDFGSDTLYGINTIIFDNSKGRSNASKWVKVSLGEDGGYNVLSSNVFSLRTYSNDDIVGTYANDIIDLYSPEAKYVDINPDYRIDNGISFRTIVGGAGDDEITGGLADNKAKYVLEPEEIVGEMSIKEIDSDTVGIFDESGALYTVRRSGDGVVTVIDERTVLYDEGTDTLRNIEFVSFYNQGELEAFAEIDLRHSEKIYSSGLNFPSYRSIALGTVLGTAGDDSLQGIDIFYLDAASPDSHVEYRGLEGDDQIDGNVGHDTVLYYLAPEEAVGKIRLSIDEDDPDVVVVKNDFGDLFRLVLKSDGSGRVDDLNSAHFDSGKDILSGIEVISIREPGEIAEVQWVDVFRDDSGEYVFRGSHLPEYSIDPDTGIARISGGNHDDVLDSNDSNVMAEGIDSKNPLLVIEVFPGGGDDTIIGGDAYEIVKYDLDVNFNESPDGALVSTIQSDGSVIVHDDSRDLYRVVLNYDGSGLVEDLLVGSDSGKDVFLSDIDEVFISFSTYMDFPLSQNIRIKYSENGGYEISGTSVVHYQPDLEGGGHISGSTQDDFLSANEGDGFQVSDDPETRVLLDGKQGDDVLHGGDGVDIAIYRMHELEAPSSTEYSVIDNTITLFDSYDLSEYYRFTLDQTGSGQVEDLFGYYYDEGTDTLANIDVISFDLRGDYGPALTFNFEVTDTGIDLIKTVGEVETVVSDVIVFG